MYFFNIDRVEIGKIFNYIVSPKVSIEARVHTWDLPEYSKLFLC